MGLIINHLIVFVKELQAIVSCLSKIVKLKEILRSFKVNRDKEKVANICDFY